MQEQQIEVLKTEIQKLSLSKDDVLIIKIKNLREYLQPKIEKIQEAMKKIVPNNSVIIMDIDESVEIIHKNTID